MIETLRVAYLSPDLDCDFLVCPLRAWHSFLATKIGESSDGIAATAWKIGYLADLFLGPFAILGVILKSLQVSELKAHNAERTQRLREELTATWRSMRANQGLSPGLSSWSTILDGYRSTIQREFTVREAEIDATYREIQSFVDHSVRRLNVEKRAAAAQAGGALTGEIIVSFTALDPKD